jgi:HD superfamily phosphodiesterase
MSKEDFDRFLRKLDEYIPGPWIPDGHLRPSPEEYDKRAAEEDGMAKKAQEAAKAAREEAKAAREAKDFKNADALDQRADALDQRAKRLLGAAEVNRASATISGDSKGKKAPDPPPQTGRESRPREALR